jgi:hypothetical protein
MSTSLRPWFESARPHEDICKGRFDESVFAADLMAVVQGTAPAVYLDPVEFFRKTYMTVGLETILKRIALALGGKQDAGDRVLSLQTPFGGGKTHTLLSLYHMALSGQKILQEDPKGSFATSLGKLVPARAHAVAVFSNKTCDPIQGRTTEDGIVIRTLWGELAYQLGGAELYELVRPNDENRACPQGIFADILKKASPCLILLDELADYCVAADAVAVNTTTLADQTVSFINQLIEAVGQVPRCAVVATLPASATEVAASEAGQVAFSTLEKRFGRLGADVQPVADNEISSVVRTRLFEHVDMEEASRVADAYLEMYKSHPDEIPDGYAKSEYRDRIVQSYPFHPSLLDAFYQRWGSHPDFQRTRGVLRLMASIVGDLWRRKGSSTVTQPLIQPNDIPWLLDAPQAQLTRLWGAGFQTVVAMDISGQISNAQRFDQEREGDYQREHVAEGVASAILLGSFGKRGEQSGYAMKELHLVCARPGINWTLIDHALFELDDTSFYLHSAPAGNLGKRFWYGTKPTVNKLIVQYKEQTSGQNFDEDILQELRAHGAASKTKQWDIVIDPGRDLAEQRTLALCILRPSDTWTDDENGRAPLKNVVKAISQRCGTKDRQFRNTLLFLAPTQRGLVQLRTRLHLRAALEGVNEDYADQLDQDQREDIRKRIDTARSDVQKALGPAYSVVLRVEGADVVPFVLQQPRDNFADHLASLWDKLGDEEWILQSIGSPVLKESGIGTGVLTMRSAVEAFLRFTDKPMVISQEAVFKSIVEACKNGTLGIASGNSPEDFKHTYCNESIPAMATLDGLWVIPAFDRPVPPIIPATDDGQNGKGKTAPSVIVSPPVPTPEVNEPVDAHGKVRGVTVRGTVKLEDWRDATKAFVNARDANDQAVAETVTFQITVNYAGDGLDENSNAVGAMEETAKQLGLEIQKKV